MIILAIETSCDETAVSVVRAKGSFPNATYEVLGNALRSQAEAHRAYGGVFPSLAKRDHAGALTPLIRRALEDAGMLEKRDTAAFCERRDAIASLLAREEGLADALLSFGASYHTPPIDLLAVTTGPGLEPALWVGVNGAKAAALLWDTPVVATNHMEGHILASLFDGTHLAPVSFPAVALLISGGHTELILMPRWGEYEKIGQTRDDAAGEAFDKVARMLGLPYPGGPHISAYAKEAREKGLHAEAVRGVTLPRPMLVSGNLDFSFSGIKTAVRYALEGAKRSEAGDRALAREFEEAVTEVLVAKSMQAVSVYGAQSLLVGGGVSANTYIRTTLADAYHNTYPAQPLFFPTPSLSTDNAVMIALAGHARAGAALPPDQTHALRAEGNKQHRAAALHTPLFR